MRFSRTVGPILSLFLLTVLFVPDVPGDDSTAAQRLREQGRQFPEKIVKIAKWIYTAIGYSVSNVSMIVGKDGVVLIDTGMDPPRGKKIAAQFRMITDKPVKAIIFTHSHGDHTGGAAAFFGKKRPQIWTRSDFGSKAKPLVAAGVTFHKVRGARQGGFKLPPKQREAAKGNEKQ